jgi:predicted N-acetyltransferase YhbS
MNAVSIAAIPADFSRWDQVLDLILDAFSYMDGIIDPPSSAHLLTADSLRDKARRETGFLAVKGDEIIGCVFACEQEAGFYIGKLAVATACQGQGVGRRLVEAVEDLARKFAQVCRRASDADRTHGKSCSLCAPRIPGDRTHRT